MCTAKSEGGQRCFSNVKTALVNARAAKVQTAQEFMDAADAPRNTRERLLRRGLAAEHAYEDALAQYASTEKGRADLEERRRTAPGYHQAAATPVADAPDDASTFMLALSEGNMLANRAAETKRAVRAGEMSEETALKRTEYPNDFARDYREKSIDAAVTRILGPTPTYTKTPVRHLREGNVLDSGFELTRTPYTSVRLASGRRIIEGRFPGQPVVRKEWNASTQVRVKDVPRTAPASTATPAPAPTPATPAGPTTASDSARPADTPEQARYRDLFDDRNRLKDTIYAKQQTAEDGADAHEINELDAQLVQVEAEMESLETWRRR